MSIQLANNGEVKSVVVLGKGSLAVKIAQYFYSSKDFSLLGIVPVMPEPKWTNSFSNWAINLGIEIMSLENLVLSGKKVDLGFSCFYDKILKSRDLLAFSNILNLHNGPLPNYRGVNPINWALKNNEKEHGVTIHSMTTGIDDGPIFGQVKFNINPQSEEVVDVYNRSLHFAYSLFEDVICNLEKISPIEQDHSNASYYSKGDFQNLGDRQGLKRKVDE
jgi:methionyl-tRNA formyltransferase